MEVIKGKQYEHKDGDHYIINKITKQELSNNKMSRIIDYSKINDPNEVYVRTEKHFRSSFKERDDNEYK